MSIKPTGKLIAEFRERLVEGVRIECLENTLIPDRVGAVATVVKPGKTVFQMHEEKRGHTHWKFPARVSDVVALSDNTITYRKGRFGDLITWEISNGTNP